MDQIAAGLAWLQGQLKANESETITYTNAAAQSVQIQATLQTEINRTSDRFGNTKVERTDFVVSFAAADLNFGAGPVKPQAGDLINVRLAGWTETNQYRVMPANLGEPAYTPEDPFETMLRVRAKFIGTV